MKTTKVTVARIYMTEESGLLKKIVKYLHDDAKRGLRKSIAIMQLPNNGQ